MTPKEKAKELYKINQKAILENCQLSSRTVINRAAKQCAIITVDEIIIGYEFDCVALPNEKRLMDDLNFWDNVKQELNKL